MTIESSTNITSNPSHVSGALRSVGAGAACANAIAGQVVARRTTIVVRNRWTRARMGDIGGQHKTLRIDPQAGSSQVTDPSRYRSAAESFAPSDWKICFVASDRLSV